jgi:hypothetical protein
MGCRRRMSFSTVNQSINADNTAPQDTFIVGCKFSDKIIYPESFAGNPDSYDSVYSTECGIYQPHCGLDNVMLSWGHDEVSSALSFFFVTPRYRIEP